MSHADGIGQTISSRVLQDINNPIQEVEVQDRELIGRLGKPRWQNKLERV